MFRKRKITTLILWILTLMLMTGCSDERVTQVAREEADRQAQQNTEMAQLNKDVASGTHQLVEADAQARKEIIGVHHELQAERKSLDTGWNELEQERRQIAGQRRTESMLVPVIGLILAIVLLAFCWYALVSSHRGDGTESQLNELLIQEIVPDEATLLSSSPHSQSLLGHSQADEHSAK
jgi:hypothetical protein